MQLNKIKHDAVSKEMISWKTRHDCRGNSTTLKNKMTGVQKHKKAHSKSTRTGTAGFTDPMPFLLLACCSVSIEHKHYWYRPVA